MIDRYGPAGGIPVIALHGAAANRKTWLGLARELRPDFELFVPDLPGHGDRRDERFSIEASLELVGEMLANLRPHRAIVSGDSLGGYVALAAGARFADEVEAVVAGGCSWTMTGFSGVIARASDVPPTMFERALGSERVDRLFTALMRRLLSKADADEVVAAGLRPQARSESLEELRGFDVGAIIRAIQAPLTLVNGRFDWPTRAGERAFVRAARDGALLIAPRCGHGVGVFDPATFARAIEATYERKRYEV